MDIDRYNSRENENGLLQEDVGEDENTENSSASSGAHS